MHNQIENWMNVDDDEMAHTNAWITNDSHRLKLCERNGKRKERKTIIYKENDDYDNVIIMAVTTAVVVMAAAVAAAITVAVAVAATTEFSTNQCLSYITPSVWMVSVRFISERTHTHTNTFCVFAVDGFVCVRAFTIPVSFFVNFYTFRLFNIQYSVLFMYAYLAAVFIWCSSTL